MIDKKMKILILCDNPAQISGVALQAGYLINSLLKTNKYTIRVFGGAIKHLKYDTIPVNQDFLIKPVDSFGTPEQLRNAIITERPDALMLFNDPRFFLWVWEMADEIRKICPIVYWHIWDNDPAPHFNLALYESTDLINCITHKTYELAKQVHPTGNINYISHGLPKDIFHPLPEKDVKIMKEQIIGSNRYDHFVCSWVNRNAKRKKPVDVFWSWKLFIDELEKKHGHKKASLLMHTDTDDKEGYDLQYAVKAFGIGDNICFSREKLSLSQMNSLHNISDCCMTISSSEGHGLGVTEAMFCGKPIIAIKTGGLTRQVVNPYTGEENGVAIEPAARAFIGGGSVPYIFEDHVNHEDAARALMTMYEYGPEKRKEIGLRAMKYAHEEFNLERMGVEWERTLSETIKKSKEEKLALWSLKTL
jgi:glycosyltransferase involved in cell wall biosynthesis